MRVLYDGEGLQGPFGGVSHYFAQLIRHLPSDIEVRIAVKKTCNLEFIENPFNLQQVPDLYHSFLSSAEFRGKWRLWMLAKKLFPWHYPDYEAENRRYLDELLEQGEFDVLHLTGAHTYGDAWRKVVGKMPIVITVHDLIPEIIQCNKRVEVGRRELLGAAARVIAVSENSKRDLIRLYGIDEKKVSVIYHGGPVAECRRSKGEYLLFVGGRRGYKNWDWMVAALVPLLKDGMRLVCTGLPFSRWERRYLRRLEVADCVEQRMVSAAEFPSLFSSASAFIYPSRYEGFGLPILDAWAAGCPVVLSRASCFPEIAGAAAEYFDLGNALSLREAIFRAMRRECVNRGLKRLHRFSWDRCADETAEVYRRALE